MMRLALVSLGVLLAGCGAASSSPAPSTAREPIIGGAPDDGDPAVGALWVYHADGSSQFCTGVMIAPHAFLSSAHCFSQFLPGAKGAVFFGPNAFVGMDGGGDAVDDFAIDPGYHGTETDVLAHERDVAIAHVADAVPGPYPELNRYDVSRLGLLGKSVRLVGYGRTSTQNNEAGPKQAVIKTDYRVATDTELEAGSATGLACRGDSGGPAFFTAPDGAERIVSIDSRGDTACEQHDISTRADVELGFVADFLRTHDDSPSCDADGRCGFDCSAPDPDCPCAPDGFCTSACGAPASDPDCPQSCLFDGGRCGPADPDPSSGCASARGLDLAAWLALIALAIGPGRMRRK